MRKTLLSSFRWHCQKRKLQRVPLKCHFSKISNRISLEITSRHHITFQWQLIHINKQFNLSHEGSEQIFASSSKKIWREKMLTFFMNRVHYLESTKTSSDCGLCFVILSQRRESQKFSTSHSKKSEKVKRERSEKCNRHKSKQMFYSLKRTAKIPPNGLIKWQECIFSPSTRHSREEVQKFNLFLIFAYCVVSFVFQQFKNAFSI